MPSETNTEAWPREANPERDLNYKAETAYTSVGSAALDEQPWTRKVVYPEGKDASDQTIIQNKDGSLIELSYYIRKVEEGVPLGPGELEERASFRTSHYVSIESKNGDVEVDADPSKIFVTPRGRFKIGFELNPVLAKPGYRPLSAHTSVTYMAKPVNGGGMQSTRTTSNAPPAPSSDDAGEKEEYFQQLTAESNPNQQESCTQIPKSDAGTLTGMDSEEKQKKVKTVTWNL